LESYVGLPEGVKLSDAPLVKSMLTDLPSAESGGQLPCVRGLQLLNVCATEGVARRVKLVSAVKHRRSPFILEVYLWLVSRGMNRKDQTGEEEMLNETPKSTSKTKIANGRGMPGSSQRKLGSSGRSSVYQDASLQPSSFVTTRQSTK
jgi:hypothetical protein